MANMSEMVKDVILVENQKKKNLSFLGRVRLQDLQGKNQWKLHSADLNYNTIPR